MKRTHLYGPLIGAIVLCFAVYLRLASADDRLEAAERRAFEERSELAAYRGRDGRSEAEADIAKGIPKLKEYGLIAGSPPWVTLIQQRFGVKVEVIADCVVSRELVAYAEAYNSRIERFIAEKYGSSALADARLAFQAFP